MPIHPEKLERYRDFVSIHSTNGVYDPEKGLGGLLSTLTPDPKPVVLAGMQTEVIYFTVHQLYRDVLTWLSSNGVSEGNYPITEFSTWAYCEYQKKHIKIDGSLVEIGAVVKQAHLRSSYGDDRTGYIKSVAGSELVAPLLAYVCEFVYRAGQSNINHKYDSLWRILGNTGSLNDHRRPLAVFRVVEFLMQNSGSHRALDVENGLGVQVSRSAASLILNKLGEAGIITYDSPDREIKGKRTKGWARFSLRDGTKLQDLDLLYVEIKSKRKYFSLQGNLKRIAEYIVQNPHISYSTHELSEKFGISMSRVSLVLSSLVLLNILDLQSGFKGGSIKSFASANDLTKAFYETVLLPVKEATDVLTSPPSKPLDPTKLAYFLQNYQSERSHIGPQGGEEIREGVLNILIDLNKPVKLSHVAEVYNSRAEREVGRSSIKAHLDVLVKQGLVRKPEQGYYQSVQRLD